MSKLLIVESPAKCKKIQGYLGSGWRVQATMGHIRALKEDLTAIGFKADVATQAWAPTYESIASKREAIASLKKAAAGTEVYLGSDDDREGEAIAWHTCAILGLDPATTPRVIFHEITEKALKQAVANPSRLDMNKFYAQQARTMLDMLIGFTLSPCLWRGVGYVAGLSAGRCQTPALRIIYDRDREIQGHSATAHWILQATSDTLTWKGKEETEESATAILEKMSTLGKPILTILDRQERISTSQPPKPFITSSLQQEASSRLSMNPKVTMRLAQTLYESGHITYMRTDNPIMSEEAIAEAGSVVEARWGAEYLQAEPEDKPKAKPKAKAQPKEKGKGVQGAHEGIRPTHFDITTVADPQEARLYSLIWKRSIQSVMAAETRDCVRLTAQADQGPLMETSWDRTRFAGYKILDANESENENETYEALRTLTKGTKIAWKVFTASEVYTKPPARFTEASLVRELESRGIGRPSTYATLVETVMDRKYVEKSTIPAKPVTLRGLELKAGGVPVATTRTEKSGGEKDKLCTTALGRTVIEWLLENFGDMVDYDFTAGMEQHLDEVAKGSRLWSSVLQGTWIQYADRYKTIMEGPRKDSKSKDFGDGYKMVVSKKGPLFVLETDGQKTRFATVPTGVSLDSATRADAEQAFASDGEQLGEVEGETVIRKKGPYGHYVIWKGQRISCKADETLETIGPRLTSKGDVNNTVDHTIGPYKIRRGQYGLYMYKTGGKTKPTFVSLPDTTEWASLTVEGATQLYTTFKAQKKKKTVG
jgi:DNA topoisomerase-1